MSIGPIIIGKYVNIKPHIGDIEDIVKPYLKQPDLFRLQFGLPVEHLDKVIDHCRTMVQSGLSTYYELGLTSRENNYPEEVFGHIRVDWCLEIERSFGIHGGSFILEARTIKARKEAMLLMLASLFKSGYVDSVFTSADQQNPRAQSFIASCGFKRTRILRYPGLIKTIYHYQITRSWTEMLPALHSALSEAKLLLHAEQHRATNRPRPLQDAGAPVTHRPNFDLSPVWHLITRDNLALWKSYLLNNVDLLDSLVVYSSEFNNDTEKLQALYGESMYGTEFYGANYNGQCCGVISIQRFPSSDGWLMIRGGVTNEHMQIGELMKKKLYANAVTGLIKRVEVQYPHELTSIANWWRSVGLVDEGLMSYDQEGMPQVSVMAFVASDVI